MGYRERGGSMLMDALEKFWVLLALNGLWLVGCIPVVTAGASTAALYRCVLRYRRERDIPLLRSFWKSFREEFWQATWLWLIQVGLLCVLVLDAFVILGTSLGENKFGGFFLGLLVLAVLPPLGYLMPLQAQFRNSVWGTVRNAWALAFAHMPISLLVLVVNCVPLGVFLLFPEFFLQTAVIWILLSGSVIAQINTGLLQKVFAKHIPQEETDGQ